MKTLRLPFFFLLCISLLLFNGCGDDDDDELTTERLNYDGVNDTAPILDAAVFAAYFPADQVRDFQGRELEAVEFFLATLPPSVRVVIYAAGPTDDAPGDEIYVSPILNQRINNVQTFITHRLTSPLSLTSEGIWIGIETGIEEGAASQTVGCDNGANYNPNGDRIRIGDEWLSFSLRSGGQEQVNWNIRGVIAAQ
ncbi:hypothetical protein [Neolewinella antarctica]|uniref:Lipoprotein n=1 Tax=Neolewinella antarctica TaxID=442734 RepID=A0ABX0XE66_9BACT|nr:hypothetical protein [Neolewinella antarctica]NJC27611.1 hypothetical protein [Neolewinella antarctica]